MSVYIDVFIESVLVSSIIPFMSDPSFSAMRLFGGYNMPLATVIAVFGASLGAVFNFMLGSWVLKLYRKKNDRKYFPIEKYNKFRHIFFKYFIILLPFSWVTLLDFLVFFAGFFGVRAKLALSLVIAGQIIHYGWYLFAV